MNKNKFTFVILLTSSLLGCSQEHYFAEVGFTNGSTSGRHIVEEILITTLSGRKANFAMGSINGYPGKLSTGGLIDAPAYIEGEWAKGNPEPNSGLVSYHRISADIPKDAEAKMKLMDNYYQYYEKRRGHMQVIVDGPRVRVFYTKSCFTKFNNCTPKKTLIQIAG